jgi:hypothetical protein
MIMSRLRSLAVSARARLGKLFVARLVWPLQRLFYYRLYARVHLAVRYRVVPSVAKHFPVTRRPLEAFFREVRGHTACVRCGHTSATCTFRAVAYPGHYLTDAHDPTDSVWSDLGFLCVCCWPLTDPPTRRAYARVADDRAARRRLGRELADQRAGRGRWAPGRRGGEVTLEHVAADPIAWALVEAACDDDRLRHWYDETIDDALAAHAALTHSAVGPSPERIAEIRALVARHREFWADEAEMEWAFEIEAQRDHDLGTWGSLPPFEPDELRDLCRAVFAARDLLTALDDGPRRPKSPAPPRAGPVL